jgi:stage V sporulation protein G
MEITEVRIKLMEDSDDRLQAFCSITIDDCFVIRDLKIIEGSSGPFVAMPSRKLTSHCPQCGTKNHLRSQYCNQCGGRLKEDRTVRDQDGRAKLYADIAHPINSQCREMIQKHVIEEYRAELERATQPDYVSRYDEDYDEDAFDSAELEMEPEEVEPRPPHRPPSQVPNNRTHPPRKGQFGAGIFE